MLTLFLSDCFTKVFSYSGDDVILSFRGEKRSIQLWLNATISDYQVDNETVCVSS